MSPPEVDGPHPAVGAAYGSGAKGAPLAPASSAPPMAPVVDSVLDLIGNTPMLRVTSFDTGPCESSMPMARC